MSTEFYNRNWRMPNSWNGSTDNNSKVSNYSMSFDGSSEFIDCGTDIGNYFGEDYTGEMAISIWFKADVTSSDDGIFIFTGSSPLGEISAAIYANDLEVRVRGVVVASGSFTDTSNWHNLIINLFGPSGANQVYLDGVAFSSTFTYTSGGLDFNGETFEIGHYGGTRYFSGKLDHCSIFDYALSAQQISDLQGSSSTGVGNPMSLSAKPKFYYPIGDYAAFNGSEYLVNNGALSDYNLKINPANLNQGFVVSEDYGYSAFTISMWVNQDFVGRTIWVNEDTTGANTEKISISINANSFLVFNCQGGGDSYTLSTQHNLTGDDRLFGTNRWINITAVYTGTDMILYGNANSGNFVSVSASNYPAGGTVPSSITLAQNQTIIGKANLAGLSEFRGQLSNFSVFDAALPETGSESATSLFNNGTPVNISSYSNLQGWWQFNAGSTFDAVAGIWTSPDSSSNNNSAVGNFPNSFEKMQASYLVQSNLLITQPYSRYGLSFDGTSDYIDVGNPTELQFSSSFSISCWAKINNTGNNAIISKDSNISSGAGYHIDFRSGNAIHAWVYGASDKLIATGLSIDVWYNIVFVFESTGGSNGNQSLYINGRTPLTSSTTTFAASTLKNLRIGNSEVLTGFDTNGEISNVSIWNAALTAAQITEIYNQGKPSNLNNHSAYSNLVSWWQLGENSSFDGTNWTVLDEKGTNNGTSANMTEADLVNGVGTTGNGLSDGMGGADNIIGDAPYSTANAVSYGMGVDARVSGSGNVPS